MGGNGEESILLEGICLQNFIPEFQVDADALPACGKEIVDEVEFTILESEDLDFAENHTQLIEIHSQPQELSDVFVLTCQKVLEEDHNSAMEVLVVIVGFLPIEGWDFLHLILLLHMFVKLEGILMQGGDILWQPFVQCFQTELSKFVLDCREGNISDFLDELLVRLSQHSFLKIISQLQLIGSSCMSRLLIAWPLLVVALHAATCGKYNGSEITGDNLVYTSANLLDQPGEAAVLKLYQQLPKIGDYNIAIEHKIYTNQDAICDKNSTSIQAINSANDIWLCFDQFYLLTCNQLWELVIKCGTFVEIHRPFDSNVLITLELETASWIVDQQELQLINMELSTLCAGTYHLWFVYYSRMGKFLKGVKTIYITFPSCKC